MPKDSDKGCPKATTITSGTGPDQVPYLCLTAGHLKGSATALLLAEFNAKGFELAMKHCAPCVAEWTPATKDDIEYVKQDFGGWTELQIGAIAGAHPSWQAKPVVLGTLERGAIVKPSAPNVRCRALPAAPIIEIKRGRRPEKPPHEDPPQEDPRREDPPKPPKPQHTCKQPTFSKPKGTVLARKRIKFNPIEGSADAYTKLGEWVDNECRDEVNQAVADWLAEVQKECRKLNGDKCEGVLDPSPPVLKMEKGDGGVPGTSLVYVEYRVELGEDVKGKCQPKQ